MLLSFLFGFMLVATFSELGPSCSMTRYVSNSFVLMFLKHRHIYDDGVCPSSESKDGLLGGGLLHSINDGWIWVEV